MADGGAWGTSQDSTSSIACEKGDNHVDLGGLWAICKYCMNERVNENCKYVACEVISMNSGLNNARVHLSNSNLLYSALPLEVDIILVGDMFYDTEFGNLLFQWLLKCREKGIRVFIGDPGRHALDNHKRKELSLVEEYILSGPTLLENNGFKSACVWNL